MEEKMGAKRKEGKTREGTTKGKRKKTEEMQAERKT